MASVKKITMREYNGTDYDTLYPKTIAEQVDGIYSKEDVLSDGTKALYGLANSAVPDDVLALIKPLIDAANSNANSKAKITTGSYTGTGTYGSSNPNSLTFDFEPKLLIVNNAGDLEFYYSNSLCYIKGTNTFGGQNGNVVKHLSANGNTVSWYSLYYNEQLNASGKVYYYIAIG